MTGCGVSKSTEESKATTSTETVKDGMLGNMYVEGYPIVKDKITYNIVSSFDSRQDQFQNMEFFKKLEEQSNIHIEWTLIEGQDFTQKKNLMLASGDYPDAFFMGINDTDLNMYVEQDVFIPMKELIELYAPNIQKTFEERPDYERLCTYFDGDIYSLGSANEDPCQYNPDQLFIYKPWLDKLGLEVPTTIDEFYNVLKAFKEQDPNGNGKADEIPFSAQFNNAIRGFHSLFGAFGRIDTAFGGDPTSHLVIEDGQVVFTADKPEYKEAVKFFHKCFAEGLFDQEIFTQDGKQYFAKGKTETPTLGAFVLWNADNMAGPDRKDDYIPVAPLKGPDGHQQWTSFNRNNGTIQGTTFAITSSCENPEALIRWVDQFYDKKTSVEACWGPIEQGEDGMYRFVTPPEGQSFDEYRYNQSPVWPPAAVFESDYDTFVEMPSLIKNKADVKKEYYDEFLTGQTLPYIRFNKEETEWNAAQGNDIINYTNDMLAKWLINGGIDEEWDDYIKQLEKLNLEEHIKLMQTAYERETGVN